MARKTGETRRSGAKRSKRMVNHGQIHIHASFNNTIITVTDLQGNTIVWSSAGQSGFKGSRKSTPYAARLAAQAAITAAAEFGLQEVDVRVNGPGPGREAAIRAIQGTSIRVRSITDVTPVPHNGCRPPKKRRV
jgi:small subunit ribosomal protein S11